MRGLFLRGGGFCFLTIHFLLSNIYRLVVPRLKRRGIVVETEIEYRVGAYFVLAANVKRIDWVKFLTFSGKELELRQQKWQDEQVRRDKLREGTTGEGDKEDEKLSTFTRIKHAIQRVRQITTFEVIALCLALSSHLPYIISVPFWWLMYHLFIKATMNIFILSTAADSKSSARTCKCVPHRISQFLCLLVCRNLCVRRRKGNGDGYQCRASSLSRRLHACSTSRATRR